VTAAGGIDASSCPEIVSADEPMSGFAGWVELDRAWLPAVAPADGVRHWRRDGLDVTAARDCDVAVDRKRLAIVRGFPRIEDGVLQGVPRDCGPANGLLHLYERDGLRALERLRGRYSICIVDGEGRRVLLATDRFAVYPICWGIDGKRLVFADRVDRLPLRQPAAISLPALYDYFYFHVIPAPRTIYSNVHRLRIAERLVATADGVDVARHWQPGFDHRLRSTSRDVEEQFRVLLRAAVELEASNGLTGAYLSGGTDSSTIAGFLRAIAARPVPAYTIGFDADGYDEMRYAELAARHFGLKHRAHYLQASELIAAIPVIAAALDQPFGNSSVVPAYRCAELAAADGMQRLLAGDGGDELFGGNTRYAKQKVFEVYWQLPDRLRKVVERALCGQVWAKVPGVKKLRSYVMQARVPMPERAESYNLLGRLGTDNLFSVHFLAAVDPTQPARHQAEVWSQTGNEVELVNRMLAYDWQLTLADSDLPKVCGAAALAGVDVRFPMLDDDLVDLSLSLSVTMKVRGLTLRPFFKRALRDFLPPQIVRKRKHGFGMPFGIWLARDQGLSSFVDERLDSLSNRGIFQPTALRRLRDVQLAQHAGYYGEMIWIAVMLEEWLRARAPGFRP
jgi:asparagine synthase (glutamine-hydrolysing)